MTICESCMTKDVKIVPTSSRKLFFIQCLNPMCGVTRSETLGIASAVSSIPRNIKKKTVAVREKQKPVEDWDFIGENDIL